jgi:hypothetical protein
MNEYLTYGGNFTLQIQADSAHDLVAWLTTELYNLLRLGA